MIHPAHKTAEVNRTKTMWFPPSFSTGKERDEETGYGYFGARYMDHELMTMWLSVDPMADKYPSISPYAYCNWNPVKLVDPDGMEFVDVHDDPPKGKKQKETIRQTPDGKSKTSIANPIAIPWYYTLAEVASKVGEFVAEAVPYLWMVPASFLFSGDSSPNQVQKASENNSDDKQADTGQNASKSEKQKVGDNSHNEPHGDQGRAKTKSEKQIELLKQQAQGANSKKERREIERKILRIKRDAQRKEKGENHSRIPKR